MPNKYNEIMSRVTVTPDMHERIVRNIRSADLTPQEKRSRRLLNHTKRVTYVAACCLILLTGTLVTTYYYHQDDTVPNVQGPGPELASPGINEYSSLQELVAGIGFEVTGIGEIPFEVENTSYLSLGVETAQIRYSGANNSLTFRISPGTNDNSGNYEEYGDANIIQIGNEQVTIKGNQGKYELATWNSHGFSYSLSLKKGVSEEELLSMIKSVR
ncbi:hypothetical protein ABEX25_18860 [Paenibacillus thiaminolyticus]|uniref:hypothetical protein n=1 Tax=Paenibacillus thiaminolyticus TaxID=49283 RepID=UPI003D2A500B